MAKNQYDQAPLSRSEQILLDTINNQLYKDEPLSRMEYLLKELNETLQGSTPGGVRDYESLTNKPTIGGITVDGDKTLEDYGLMTVSTSSIDKLWE